MNAHELAGWLNAHGWSTETVDGSTVRAERPGKPARMYLRETTITGHRWRIVRIRAP